MIGRVLGHYRILERIGAGGMGEVYRAHDERLERDVALKLLPAGAFADETARKRLRKEALALSRLSHPHIAAVHDFDTQDGIDFLAMELTPDLLWLCRPVQSTSVALRRDPRWKPFIDRLKPLVRLPPGTRDPFS